MASVTFATVQKAKGDQCDECQQLLDPLLIINPKCKVCGTTPQIRKSDHLYLDLDKLQPKLESFLSTTHSTSNSEAITATWLKKGLQRRCITRDLKWGTPVPNLPGLEKYQGEGLLCLVRCTYRLCVNCCPPSNGQLGDLVQEPGQC